MLVKPLPSYGCLTCGFRCLSSQMIQLHWRHWHQAFIAPAPAKQGDPFKQPEAVSDSRMMTPPVTSSSSNQSKHPTKLGVATFKDKSVDSTGKHWAVRRFGSATASCNSKTYISFYSVLSAANNSGDPALWLRTDSSIPEFVRSAVNFAPRNFTKIPT